MKQEEKPKNPNAFPIALKDNNNPFNSDAKGMSLRDYFAAKAMESYLSNSYAYSDPDIVAKSAYKVADTMLKQREL